MENIEIYDTTLRDGTQGYGVSLSLADKLALSEQLDELGVDYVEGGWPGSNPKDRGYFEAVRRLQLRHSKVSAFGSTRRHRLRAEEDPNLISLVESAADVVCIVGKSWELHVVQALRVSLDENLSMIVDSVEFLRRATGRPVFYDAEHFFDGLRESPECALRTLRAAHEAGAERLILCDTNGGALPGQIAEGVRTVREMLPEAKLGIHVHNDGGLAVANTLAGLGAGCVQAQGTINGVGERCGNADLVQVIANCELKLGRPCIAPGGLPRLTDLSRSVWERINQAGPDNQPYVGAAAFAHKGGIHVSAMARDERTYEHIAPSVVGNRRRILISEMAGRSSLLAKLEHRYPALRERAVSDAVLEEVQRLEHAGYAFEAADASLDLLVRRHVGLHAPSFRLHYYRVHGIAASEGRSHESDVPIEATVKVEIGGRTRLCAAEGNGPVDALNHALLAALMPSYPQLEALCLSDYKVRVVNSSEGTAGRVRVLIEHTFAKQRFGTVGVHVNIIEASWLALVDAVDHAVLSIA